MFDVVALLAGGFLAGAISGAVGFGGALLLLPLLTHLVGVTAAVPLLTVGQLVGNVTRAWLGWREIRWRPVGLFLLGAIPAAAIGAASFLVLPKDLVVRLVGLAVIGFVLLRLTGVLALRPTPALLTLGGVVVGALSGLVGSAGPLGAAIFLTLHLPPVAYLSSEAVTAVAMHAVKILVYGKGLDFPVGFWGQAAALGAALVSGTWVSRRLVAKVPTKAFGWFVSGLLVILGLQLVLS